MVFSHHTCLVLRPEDADDGRFEDNLSAAIQASRERAEDADDSLFKKDISKAIEDSRQSAAMKKCYTCGSWTRNPISSQIHMDCIHTACCLTCVIIMDEQYHTLIMEMRELDEGVQRAI